MAEFGGLDIVVDDAGIEVTQLIVVNGVGLPVDGGMGM